MTDEKRNRLKAAGLSYDEALARMMNNEGLLERVLRKFVNDASFGELEAAFASGDFKKAGEAAHTLKGVSGNLGFSALSETAAELMARLRDGRTDDCADLRVRLAGQYRAAIDALTDL